MINMFPLTVQDAISRRRGKTLVGPIDLTLDGVGTCVILGPNGAGKTTLLRLLHGTARLNAGTIRWACDTKTARQHQSFVFQRPVMLRRSVEQNLTYPLLMRGQSRAEARHLAREWAEQTGLSNMLDRQATVLSGGEQQKLAIARALITRPGLVFLDEPTASLDGRAMREIEMVLDSAKSAGTRLIISTHDMGQARRLADTAIFLLGGKVHETGLAEDFFASPRTAQAAAFLKGDIVE